LTVLEKVVGQTAHDERLNPRVVGDKPGQWRKRGAWEAGRCFIRGQASHQASLQCLFLRTAPVPHSLFPTPNLSRSSTHSSTVSCSEPSSAMNLSSAVTGGDGLLGSGRSNTILDLPFRRLGRQNVEDHRRCVILIRLPAEPLHEVPERGGLHASDLFRGVRLFPIPVGVFLSAAHHQLRTPGKKLVLVRHSLRDQKIESGFSFVGVSNHSGGELGPLSGVLGDEPLRGGPDLGGRAPPEAELVPDAVWASSVAWVHRHDFGGHPLIIADLGLDFVANPELKNHNLSPPYSRWVLLFCDEVLPRDTFRINTLLS